MDHKTVKYIVDRKIESTRKELLAIDPDSGPLGGYRDIFDMFCNEKDNQYGSDEPKKATNWWKEN